MFHNQNFILKLKKHILPRIAAIHQEGILEQAELTVATDMDLLEDSDDAHLRLSWLNHIVFNGNKIYRHRLLRINYTTYDLQRENDTINPCTDNQNIMLLSNLSSNNHLFSYKRVLGIFHANVIQYTQALGQRIFGLVGLNFCGYGGLNLYRNVLQPSDGSKILWTLSGSCRWLMKMHSVLLILPTCSEVAMSSHLLLMVNFIPMGLQYLIVRVILTTGSTIISIGWVQVLFTQLK